MPVKRLYDFDNSVHSTELKMYLVDYEMSIINNRIPNAVKKQSLKSHLLIFAAKISIHFSCLRRDHSGGGHVHRVGRFVPGQHHLQPAHPHQGR
jgi:hypothetical protein